MSQLQGIWFSAISSVLEQSIERNVVHKGGSCIEIMLLNVTAEKVTGLIRYVNTLALTSCKAVLMHSSSITKITRVSDGDKKMSQKENDKGKEVA